MHKKDNPIHFSGESNDWSTFKQDIQSRADRFDTTWLFEGACHSSWHGRSKTRLEMLNPRITPFNGSFPPRQTVHVPTSCDDYKDKALKTWFDERDFATDLLLSLNKNRLASLGSNFCDHTKLGFRDEAALEKAHKAVDLAYLRKINQSACKLLHDAVFDHPTKETAARTKLNSILKTTEVVEILKGAVEDAMPTANGLTPCGKSQLCRSGAKDSTSPRV